MHGWVWEGIQKAQQLFGTFITNKTTRLFVTNDWQKEFLFQEGYTDVHVIGLPVVYLEKREIKRQNPRLIVMPSHNIPGMDHDRKKEKEYIDYIKSIEHYFETVIACIHAHDFSIGNWKNQFQKAGINTISGVYDGPDALQAQQDRLSTFTHMTTNQIGSHVVYAGALGLNVSIAGPYNESVKSSWKDDFYIKYPETLDNAIERCSKDYWRKKAPWLFTNPYEAQECLSWARNEIGYENRKNHNELKKLLGWSFREDEKIKKITVTIRDLDKKLRHAENTITKQASYIQELESACSERLKVIEDFQKKGGELKADKKLETKKTASKLKLIIQNIKSNLSKKESNYAVVVPVYREKLDAEELISVRQLKKVIKNKNIIIICPCGLKISNELICFNKIEFPKEYFNDINGYNNLMLSTGFYKAFIDYKSILIYQLDCLIYRNELQKWMKKNYSYVAPPWFAKFWNDPELGLWKVGNGGFSLRKISSAIKVLDTKVPRGTMNAAVERAKNSYIDPLNTSNHYRLQSQRSVQNDTDFVSVEEDLRDYPLNEDLFWSFEAPLIDPSFKIPSAQEALGFAFEKCPKWCFEKNMNTLPMGCHAWFKEDREFWEGFLSKDLMS